MPDDDYQVLPLCEACRQLACACATSVADIDAWADAYLGSEAHAQDYFQLLKAAQRLLVNLHPGTMETPRSPACLEDMEPPLYGDDTC